MHSTFKSHYMINFIMIRTCVHVAVVYTPIPTCTCMCRCRTRLLEKDLSFRQREKLMMMLINVMKVMNDWCECPSNSLTNGTSCASQALRVHNNFNSYLAILSAIECAPISRLDWSERIVKVRHKHPIYSVYVPVLHMRGTLQCKVAINPLVHNPFTRKIRPRCTSSG